MVARRRCWRKSIIVGGKVRSPNERGVEGCAPPREFLVHRMSLLCHGSTVRLPTYHEAARVVAVDAEVVMSLLFSVHCSVLSVQYCVLSAEC